MNTRLNVLMPGGRRSKVTATFREAEDECGTCQDNGRRQSALSAVLGLSSPEVGDWGLTREKGLQLGPAACALSTVSDHKLARDCRSSERVYDNS
ncbi:hypothetical protein V5799_032956 [Amblyomma americanum]|uniref:Uncharacterized protein n=1 Tax=Amblyomma americanum TaxID=6943 RepID=A0AAQ4DPP5_AMBAM